jgi:APA family basic amino acid/polyamine antiporter
MARDQEQEAAGSLVRGLGWLDATMVVVGSMIGSGIFITSAESARTIGAPGWLLLAWAMAGLLTITGALCCAELSAMMPRAGGQYVFLREAYGPLAGFVFGWSTFLVVGTGTIAAVAVAFSKFLGVLVPWVQESQYLIEPIRLGSTAFAISLSTQQLVAVGVIAVLTLANTQGLRTGKLIQNVLTFAKTGALIALVVLGLTIGLNRDSAALTSSWWNPTANGWTPDSAGS